MATQNYNSQKSGPDIGQMLTEYIEERRISKASLSRKLQRSQVTVHKYMKRSSLQAEILWQLSTAMKHNFFLDLAAQLPPEFSTKAPDPTLPLQDRIAVLEEENKLLHAKVDTLMEVVRK